MKKKGVLLLSMLLLMLAGCNSDDDEIAITGYRFQSFELMNEVCN